MLLPLGRRVAQAYELPDPPSRYEARLAFLTSSSANFNQLASSTSWSTSVKRNPSLGEASASWVCSRSAPALRHEGEGHPRRQAADYRYIDSRETSGLDTAMHCGAAGRSAPQAARSLPLPLPATPSPFDTSTVLPPFGLASHECVGYLSGGESGVAPMGYEPTRLQERLTGRPLGVVRSVSLAIRCGLGDTAVETDAFYGVGLLVRGDRGITLVRFL